jgi:hypothetical protein
MYGSNQASGARGYADAIRSAIPDEMVV